MSIRARFWTFFGALLAAPAVLAVSPLTEPPAASARALDVSAVSVAVEGPRIVLGETASVEVSIKAVRADGSPLDVAPPQLQVSTGTVTAPQRSGPGLWRTTFTPPKDAFPHVAILFATIETATTSSVGFASLHLWGKGQTTVKTKPKSSVTVFIGNESFGPVVADGDGAARVPIIVPPGPERAVARSIDEVGNESQKTIDLGVPTFNRLAAVALDDTVSADGGGAARVLAFVVDKKGDPLYQAKLKGKASVGIVDKEVTGLAPGMFLVLFRPGKAARGKATIDLTLEGAPGSKAQAAVEVLTGRPTRAAIEAERTTLSADDPRALAVALRLYDGGGNAVPAQAASVDVDLGRIEAIESLAGGGRKLTWMIPAELSQPKATLTVRLPSGEVLGTMDVGLSAGKPAAASFAPIEGVTADGQSSVEVRLSVVDRAGNPLPPTGATLAVDPAYGRLLGAAVDGGSYRARFVAEPRDSDDVASITASVGALAAEAKVKLGARSRARLLVSSGVLVGSNYGSLLQAGPELSLLVRLPGFDGGAYAGLTTAVLQSVSAPAGVDHRAFPLALEGAWRPLLTPELVLHLGLAAGFVLTDEIRGAARVVTPGALAQGVLGAGYRLGPGFLELDVRAGIADTFPSSTTVGLPLGAAAVLGYRFGV